MANKIYCDTETTGLKIWKDYPFMLQWGTKGKVNIKRLQPEEDCSFLIKCDSLIFHNASFDIKMLVKNGHLSWQDVLKTRIEDTMLKARLVYDRWERYGLKELSASLFNDETAAGEKRVLKEYMRKYKISSYDEIPDEILLPYAEKDIILTHELDEYLESKDYPKDLYEQELKLLKIIAEIELNGVRIDEQKLNEWYMDIGVKLLTMPVPVKNPTNDNEIAEWLFKVKGFPTRGKTMTGKLRVDKDVLAVYKDDPEVAQLIKWKHLKKLHATFLGQLIQNTYAGRVYMGFNQMGAVTGRMSSSNPNLQNLPAGAIEGYDIRNLIIPEDGCKLVSIDLSQIEIRVFAYYSGDRRMIEAINSGQDFHQWTADLLGISRKEAKAVNFGIIYGMGIQTLANRLNVSYDEAKQIRYRYYRTFPAIRRLNDRIKREVAKKGYIFNLYGRKYHLTKDEAYKGLNRLVQGTSADLFKENVIRIYNYLKDNKLKTRMWLFVHDEIIFNVPTNELDILPDLAKLLADNSKLNGKVKLDADTSVPMDRWEKC